MKGWFPWRTTIKRWSALRTKRWKKPAAERQIAYAIPETALDHRIAIIRKTGPSPKKYPRRWAQIKKKPL